MKPTKCEKCGATEFEEQNGMYVCKYCGAQYPMDQGESAPASNQTAQATQAAPGNINVNVNVQNTNPGQSYVIIRSPKSWTVALVLSIFLGYLGIHRFYTGKVGTGILWLITLGWFGIGWIVDIIMIATGHFKDKKGQPIISNKKANAK